MSLFRRQLYNNIMPIRFIRNDITKIKADALVNTANPYPVIGGGTDTAVYQAAGKEKLLAERQKIGNIERGDAVITKGFDLSKYIIHTVGPSYIDGEHDEKKILRSCYKNSMRLAKENQCNSIVFPLISTGSYGFPKEEAISIAYSELADYLLKEGVDMDVIIAVFDDESYVTCLKIASQMEEYIDSSYSKEALKEEYGSYYDDVMQRAASVKKQALTKNQNKKTAREIDKRTLADMINYYLSFRQEKDSEIYRSAEIDRRLWSKILRKDYHPSKDTVIRVCFALKLTLSQSIDLLSRADYAFNPSKEEDHIYMQCLKKKKSYSEALKLLYQKG